VVLPNRLYDPVKGAEEYARHIDALVYADELGFDAIGVNEHHHGYLTLYILVSPDRKGHSDDGQKLIAALNFRNAEQFAEAARACHVLQRQGWRQKIRLTRLNGPGPICQKAHPVLIARAPFLQ
jgi:hypothetical protein